MALCLVTGGAGFIGSHLVDGLVAQGHHVRVLDNFTTGTLANLDNVQDKIEVISADVTEAAAYPGALRDVELVFHHASEVSVPRSIHDPLATHEVCATATLHLLQAAREAGVRRVIYAATSTAYGNSDRLPNRETDLPRPLSPYAVAKLAGEHYCETFTQLYGLETVRLRYFNVFGPRQSAQGPYAAVIPRTLEQMMEGRNPIIHGDGLQSRDFTYVDDVVQANLLAARAQRVAGKVYNIAYGQRTTLLELVNYANALLGTNLKPTHVPPRPGDIRHTLADTTRAQAELGYCASTDLKEGLNRCIKYLRAEKKKARDMVPLTSRYRGPHRPPTPDHVDAESYCSE
jgi:UDP-glucose 4-epimerase